MTALYDTEMSIGRLLAVRCKFLHHHNPIHCLSSKPKNSFLFSVDLTNKYISKDE